MRLHAPPAALRRGARVLRAPPGHLVLAHGPPAGAGRPARGPRLPRRLLGGRRAGDGPAGEGRLALPSREGRRRGRARAVIPALIVFLYLAVVLYIGVFAFRRPGGREQAEEYFLASRSLGPFVFLLSLFGTNMTAFAILGSSGHAFHNGIVTYGLMASASGLVIPLSLFFIGTRVWALGKRFGFITPVQLFRDRWEMSHIGTLIFVVQAALLVPYIIIGVMGGGTK